MKTKAKVQLMSPADRRRLVEAPMPALSTVHSGRKSWGGTYINRDIPTEGRRVWKHGVSDEDYYVQNAKD